jgi:hypothetical protein
MKPNDIKRQHKIATILGALIMILAAIVVLVNVMW